MIQIIAKLDEVFNYILNMTDCTILIKIEKFDSCDFTKENWTSF
jgi:hypothetical protein